MKLFLKVLRNTAFAASFVMATTAIAAPGDDTAKLLSIEFEPRQVVKIEAGDFHFVPKQIAPVHTHKAPAIGFVAKGAIIYQVEGAKTKTLRRGDAFYEPAGPRILRFDNDSATQEAIFIDINLQQKGEPFIVFPKPLTEKIDRRTLPTITFPGNGIRLEQADVYSSDLDPSGSLTLDHNQPTIAYVAEGVVEVSIDGNKAKRIIAGATFALPKVGSKAIVVNKSSEVSAKVITFRLK